MTASHRAPRRTRFTKLRPAVAIATAVALVAASLSVGIASASASGSSAHTITVNVAGVRTDSGVSATQAGAALAGAKYGVFTEPSEGTYAEVAGTNDCTVPAGGSTCTITGVPTGGPYFVRQTASAPGYAQPITQLDTGSSGSVSGQPYEWKIDSLRGDVTVPSAEGGSDDSVEVTGAPVIYNYECQDYMGCPNPAKWISSYASCTDAQYGGRYWHAWSCVPILDTLNKQQFSASLASGLTNPTVAQSCGLNIALVLDTSESMASGSKMATVKNTLLGTGYREGDGSGGNGGVLDALATTPTDVDLFSFATAASGFRHGGALSDPRTLNTLKSDVAGLDARGNTNWDDGLYQVVSHEQATGKQYDLVLFLTDGAPTKSSAGGNGNDTTFQNIDHAIFSANAIKAYGTGKTSIEAVGIEAADASENLAAISGPNDYYEANNASDITDRVESLLEGACASALTVTKQIVDADGSIVADQTPGQGIAFSGSVNSTALTFQNTSGGKNGASPTTYGTTTSDQFKMTKGNAVTVTVTESVPAGQKLVGAACQINGSAVTTTVTGNSARFTDAAYEDEPLSCTFKDRVLPVTTAVAPNAATYTCVTGAAVGALTKPTTTGIGYTLKHGSTVVTDWSNLAAGTYTLVAAADTDYVLRAASGGWSGDASEQSLTITIGGAGAPDCTVAKGGLVTPATHEYACSPNGGSPTQPTFALLPGGSDKNTYVVKNGSTVVTTYAPKQGETWTVLATAPPGYVFTGLGASGGTADDTWYFAGDAGHAIWTHHFPTAPACSYQAQLKQTDAQTSLPLPGAAFGLFVSDSGQGTPVTSAVTGSGGTASVTGVPAGSYYWCETAAPAGYQLSPDCQAAALALASAPAPTASVFVDNQIATATVEVDKQATDGTALNGAVFGLYLRAGATPDISTDLKIGEVTTADGGTATLSLSGISIWGTYYWYEQQAPTGYTLPATRTQTFTIGTADGDVVPVASATTAVEKATFTDAQKTTDLTVAEVDNDGGAGLAGAVFQLFKDGSAYGAPVTTGAAGTYTVTGLPFGTYYFVEKQAPSGYLMPTDVLGAETTQVTISASNAGNTLNPLTIGADKDAPGVTVVKTADVTNGDVDKHATYSAVGDVVNYTIAVTNTGNGALHSLTIADALSGLSDVVCPGATNGVFSLAKAAAEDCTATYTVTQSDIDNGSILNTATATGTSPTGQTVTDSSTATVTADQTAALSVTNAVRIGDGTDDVTSGSYDTVNEDLTYKITVTNAGNVTVDDISVTDTDFSGDATLGALDCGSGFSLEPGQSHDCLATYSVDQADLDRGSIANAASAAGTDPNGDRVTADSNEVTLEAATAATLTLTGLADVNGTGTVYTKAGDTVNYAFAVINTGNVTVRDLSVSDAMLAGADDDVTCPVTTLAPGASTTCTATYTASTDDVTATKIVNTATVTGTDPKGDAVTSNPGSAEVDLPALTVEQRGYVNGDPSSTTYESTSDVVTWQLTVTNAGSVALTDLDIDEDFAGTGTLSDADCPDTTIAVGDSVTCSATSTVTQDDLDRGAIDNAATASVLWSGGNADSPLVSDEAQAEVAASQDPGVTLVKSADVNGAGTVYRKVGDTVGYTYTVTNTGNVSLGGLQIEETEFTGSNSTGLSDPNGSCAPEGQIAPGDSAVCTATYAVTQEDLNAGQIDNSATATVWTPREDELTTDPSTATVTAQPVVSKLWIHKSVDKATFQAGDTLTYTYEVANSDTEPDWSAPNPVGTCTTGSGTTIYDVHVEEPWTAQADDANAGWILAEREWIDAEGVHKGAATTRFTGQFPYPNGVGNPEKSFYFTGTGGADGDGLPTPSTDGNTSALQPCQTVTFTAPYVATAADAATQWVGNISYAWGSTKPVEQLLKPSADGVAKLGRTVKAATLTEATSVGAESYIHTGLSAPLSTAHAVQPVPGPTPPTSTPPTSTPPTSTPPTSSATSDSLGVDATSTTSQGRPSGTGVNAQQTTRTQSLSDTGVNRLPQAFLAGCAALLVGLMLLMLGRTRHSNRQH